MSSNDRYRCDRCGNAFNAKAAARNRYLDLLCPACGSLRVSCLPSHAERLNAAVAESNSY